MLIFLPHKSSLNLWASNACQDSTQILTEICPQFFRINPYWNLLIFFRVSPYCFWKRNFRTIPLSWGLMLWSSLIFDVWSFDLRWSLVVWSELIFDSFQKLIVSSSLNFSFFLTFDLFMIWPLNFDLWTPQFMISSSKFKKNQGCSEATSELVNELCSDYLQPFPAKVYRFSYESHWGRAPR